MTLDKRKVQMHFDRHAREYDQYAIVQRIMADRLQQRLAEQKPLEKVRRVVEIGCGTGLMTGKLLELYPDAQIVALDISSGMVELVRERWSESISSGRLQVWQGDAERLGDMKEEPWRNSSILTDCDVIVSNAVFQWFNKPEQTIRDWTQRLRTDGIFAFASFGPETFHELHESFREAESKMDLPPKRHGQNFLGLPEWKKIFQNQSNSWVAERFKGEEDFFVQKFPDVRHFLHSVKRVGAGNANEDTEGLSRGGRRLFAEMQRVYLERFSCLQGIHATYHLIYGIFHNN